MHNRELPSMGSNNNNHISLFFLLFFAGLLNSKDYFQYLDFDIIILVISFLFHIFLFYLFLSTILSFLMKKNNFRFYSFPYWMILLAAIFIKWFLLFIQSPGWVLPGGIYFYEIRVITINIILLITVAIRIKKIQDIKAVIWGLGLGTSLTFLIPLILFPEMIGSRAINVNNYSFTGGFWNSSVISFISIGWLLVALSTIEKSKTKKYILLAIFILTILGGLAGLSRSILLSIIISVIVYLIAAKQFLKYIKAISWTAILAVTIILIFPQLVDNFEQRFTDGVSIEEEPRVDIWLDYIEDLPKYILFGDIKGEYKRYSETGHGPHTVLLNWLTRYGILALMGFFAIIFGIIKAIKRIQKDVSLHASASAFAWLASYLAVAVINETGFLQLTVYGAMGVLLGWGNFLKKESFSLKSL